MALQNNKSLATVRMKRVVADNAKSIARNQYLPKITALGSYLHTSKEISILNDSQKAALSSMGSSIIGGASQTLPSVLTDLVQNGLLTQQQAAGVGSLFQKYAPQIAQIMNEAGGNVADAFRTDTRNLWVGSVTLTQPIFMGGRISAANKIADISQSLAVNEADNVEQTVLIDVEKAYWLAVSLKQKQSLAQKFYELLKKLHGDVQKMVAEGVATKADELSVNVKVNDAEMTLTQVNNGLSLSKMALCQICGLSISDDIVLADESAQTISNSQLSTPNFQLSTALANRPEIKMLENAYDITKQGVKLARANYMPILAMNAGYLISNPNVFNGFQKNFSGVWSAGLVFSMPVWDWGDTKYKIRAAKAASNMAELKLQDAKELIHLQLNQTDFKLKEAQKRVTTTQNNIKSADENLRAATLGFKEGVMTTSNVLEAQTAWLKAQTQKIDAEIDLRIASAEMKKTLGIIKY